MTHLQHILFASPFIVILFWVVSISLSAIIKAKRFQIPFIIFLLNCLFAFNGSRFIIYRDYDALGSAYALSAFCTLSMFPFFYLYIKNLTSEEGLRLKDYIVHLTFPFVCCLTALVVLFLFSSLDERNEFIREALFRGTPSTGIINIAYRMDKVFRISFIVFSVFYFILTERTVKRHRKNILNYFSNIEDSDINRYSKFRIVYSFTVIGGGLYHIIEREVLIENVMIPMVCHLLLAVFFWIISYYASNQTAIYSHVKLSSNENINFKALEEALTVKMQEEHIFTDRSLTLPKMARELNTNRTYLSRYINEHLNITFNTYINRNRVDYAKELLSADSKMNMDILYSKCGFNSSSTFYKCFSRMVGMSPTKFRADSATVKVKESGL